MSETVHYRGKLIKLDKLPNETLELQCKRVLGELIEYENILLEGYYDSYESMLKYEYYKQYTTHNNDLYQVIYREIDTDEDIFQVIKTQDGYVFEVKYYNGGCGFTEAMEYAFDKLDGKG